LTIVSSVLAGAAVFAVCFYVGSIRDPAKSAALRQRVRRGRTRQTPAFALKALFLFRPRCEPHIWEEVFYSLAFRLRAGETLPQAVRGVSEEGSTPAHESLKRIVRVYEAGTPLAQAFHGHATGSEMERLAATVETGLLTGSDLPALLCHSAEVLSRKRSLVKEAQAKVAESRLTALLLIALPWIIGAITCFYDPALLSQGLSSPRGRTILAFSLGLWIVGVVLIAAALSTVTRGRND
jgi:Flp pilus assembly protein TadB